MYKLSTSITSPRRIYRSRYSLKHGVVFFLTRAYSNSRFCSYVTWTYLSFRCVAIFNYFAYRVNRRSQEVRGVNQAFGSLICVVYVYINVVYVWMHIEHVDMCRTTSLDGFRGCDIINAERMAKYSLFFYLPSLNSCCKFWLIKRRQKFLRPFFLLQPFVGRMS